MSGLQNSRFFFFFPNRFWIDTRGRRGIFATSGVLASHARRLSLTLRFHPLAPDFSFDRALTRAFFTVLSSQSPMFFFKIVRIERLPVRMAHLDLTFTQGVHMKPR